MKIGTVKVALSANEPNVFIGNRCNQNCLFCSEGIRDFSMPAAQIRAIFDLKPKSVSIEGGEPTLAKNLIKYVRLAKSKDIREIILCTNGTGLGNPRFVRDLCAAGVTLFNVNFPSQDERVFDFLTQTHGQFPKRIAAIQTLMGLAGGRRVRINCVVNRLNYMTLENYAYFISKTFPGTFYAEFNLIKMAGYVTNRPYLVPRLSESSTHLCRALSVLRRMGTTSIVDGFPLCCLKGHESAAIDAYKKIFGDTVYMNEKTKTPRCARCSLADLCAGPRKDYVRFYGDSELRSSRKDPSPIRDAILASGDTVNAKIRAKGSR